jgi:spore coat protein SA
VAFCSKYVMEGALAKIEKLTPERCLLLRNGADLAPESPVPERRFKSPLGPVILFVGRVVEQKGLHLLIEAMPRVLEHFPASTLRVVGGVRFGSREIDPYLARLRNLAASMGGRVEFVGPVPHNTVGNYLRDADVFACPSIWNDPFPLVTLEAMGAGVPVVAFARGGIPEAVGDAGVLLQEAGAEPLASALLLLLQNVDLRLDLGRQGRERVAKYFTWGIIARHWEEQLKQWL